MRMNWKLALVALCCTATALIPAVLVAQDLHPSRRPSPTGIARITLDDGTYVRVVYSRPYKRNRDNIFGTSESEALVPFGELWRTGANEATEITVTKDVMIGEAKLPAGTYSLFTTPGPEKWKVHFNSALGLSGAFAPNPETGEFENAYKAENDVVAITVPSRTTQAAEGEEEAEEVDQFTFAFEEVEGGADMILRWITTEVRVPVKPAG